MTSHVPRSISNNYEPQLWDIRQTFTWLEFFSKAGSSVLAQTPFNSLERKSQLKGRAYAFPLSDFSQVNRF